MRELGVQIRDLKIVVTTQLLIFAVENVTVRLPGPPLSSHQTVTATISLQRPPVAVTRPDQQQLQSPPRCQDPEVSSTAALPNCSSNTPLSNRGEAAVNSRKRRSEMRHRTLKLSRGEGDGDSTDMT